MNKQTSNVIKITVKTTYINPNSQEYTLPLGLPAGEVLDLAKFFESCYIRDHLHTNFEISGPGFEPIEVNYRDTEDPEQEIGGF